MNEIFHRVSIRKYEDKPVEKDKIMQILKAGMQAPSAGNQQPWEFYVVTDKEKIQALAKAHQYAGCAAGAPVLIVPVYRKEGLWVPEYAQIDMAIAQENIWLETDSLGLGGVWLGIAHSRTVWIRWRKSLLFRIIWRHSLSLHWDILQRREPNRIGTMKTGSTSWNKR